MHNTPSPPDPNVMGAASVEETVIKTNCMEHASPAVICYLQRIKVSWLFHMCRENGCISLVLKCITTY